MNWFDRITVMWDNNTQMCIFTKINTFRMTSLSLQQITALHAFMINLVVHFIKLNYFYAKYSFNVCRTYVYYSISILVYNACNVVGVCWFYYSSCWEACKIFSLLDLENFVNVLYGRNVIIINKSTTLICISHMQLQ